MVLNHASCVDFDGAGVLIFGGSGAGKSDLALRLIDAGAVLVADDYVETIQENGQLYAYAPDTVKGLIEVRGIGILQTEFKEKTCVKLKVCLCALNEVDRMPLSFAQQVNFAEIPVLKLAAFESSAIVKVKRALAVILGKNGLIS